jgi:hypothetical protein
MARREIEELRARLDEHRGREDALQQQLDDLRTQQEARPPPQIRTHMPDKFEGRKDDLEQFLDDVRSYCLLTNVPVAKQVDYAVRCLGKTVKKVWLSKKAKYLRLNPGAALTLDIFGQLLSNVYDNSDKVTKARDKLDQVYQGSDTLERYVERFTTLLSEVEVGGELSGGEKIHRFRKGLRDELKKVAVLDPTTGAPYQDIDALISALTKYDAAVGGTAQGKRQRLGGGPSVAVTTVDHAYPTATPDGTWTGHAYGHAYQPIPTYAAAPMAFGYYPQATPLASMAGGPPLYPRRDGAPPQMRVDKRIGFNPDRQCFSCQSMGHEAWFCPFKHMMEHPETPLSAQQLQVAQQIVRDRRARGVPLPAIPAQFAELINRGQAYGGGGMGGTGPAGGRHGRGRGRGRGRGYGRGRGRARGT